DAAAPCRGLAHDAQDGDLCDAQCRRSCLSGRSRAGDDGTSRHGQRRHADPAAAPARSAVGRVSRLSEGAVASAWPSAARVTAQSIQTRGTGEQKRRNTMSAQRNKQSELTRRNCLAATAAAGVLALGPPARRALAAPATVRQGYQTNIWGMPTYYLLKSGYLEKHGVAAEEFAVPSGNLTMQQMVARQVDLGTYAAQSFIIGHAKGSLVAIALIEHVGKTARITARKDLNISKVEDLRGRRIANQTGSSVGNVFVDTIMPQHGLNKGDYTEVRMDVNNMVAALAAKTVDAMVNVEPYNVIAVADGIGGDLMDFSAVDPMPVFMAATPDFVQSKPDVVIAYLKAWLDVAK